MMIIKVEQYLSVLEKDKGEVKLSPAMSEIVKMVQQCKWTLMRTRQQLSRGYKEVSWQKFIQCCQQNMFSLSLKRHLLSFPGLCSSVRTSEVPLT